MQKGAELLGGRDKLAKYLGVPETEIRNWLAGTSKPPLAVFLRAVELIIDETTPPVDASDPGGEPSAPRDCSSASAYQHGD